MKNLNLWACLSIKKFRDFFTSVARFHQPKNLHLSLYTKKFEFFHPIGRVPSIEDSQYVGLSLSNKKCGLYHLSYGLNHLLLVQHLLYLHYWSQPPPPWSPSTWFFSSANRGHLGDQCGSQARTKVRSGAHTQR